MIAFSSSENLADETDVGDTDVYAWSTAASTSSPTLVTAGPGHSGVVKGISRDGSKIFYESAQDDVGTSDGLLTDVFVGTPGGAAPVILADFPLASGTEHAVNYAGNSPDGGTVAFETLNGFVSGDNDATLRDLYENAGGSLEWLTMPGSGATGGDPTGEVVNAVCDGGAAVFRTPESLVGADLASVADFYRHPAGVGTLPQLLTSGNTTTPSFMGASSDCSRVAVATASPLGGLGGGNAATPDAFLITGTTPSLIALDVLPSYLPGPDLKTLIFGSTAALVGGMRTPSSMATYGERAITRSSSSPQSRGQAFRGSPSQRPTPAS